MNTSIHELGEMMSNTARGVTTRVYRTLEGFMVAAANLATGQIASERFSDILELMDAATRVDSTVRYGAL